MILKPVNEMNLSRKSATGGMLLIENRLAKTGFRSICERAWNLDAMEVPRVSASKNFSRGSLKARKNKGIPSNSTETTH